MTLSIINYHEAFDNQINNSNKTKIPDYFFLYCEHIFSVNIK